MTPFELAAILLAFGALAACMAIPRAMPWLLASAALALCLALFANPARWQLFPAVVALVLLALVQWRSRRFGGKTLVAAGALLVLTAALAQVFALVGLPKPPGPYAVGTAQVWFVRPSDDGPRRLFVKLWYPAQDAAGEPEGLWSELPRMTDIPAPLRWGLAYLNHVPAHAYSRAPYANDAAPHVVLYNHSFVSWASENSLLAEDLASRGFTVIAVRHMGQVAEYDALGRNGEGAASDIASAFEVIRRRVADSRFVADRLGSVLGAVPRGPAGAPPAYAAMGFSLGGAFSTDLCASDRRCGAVVNVDGPIRGVDYPRLPIPHYLMILGAGRDGVPAAQGSYQRRDFARAAHLDFHDSAIALPVTRWFFGRSASALTRERREQGELIAVFLARAGL